jgi:hypothetical protein
MSGGRTTNPENMPKRRMRWKKHWLGIAAITWADFISD